MTPTYKCGMWCLQGILSNLIWFSHSLAVWTEVQRGCDARKGVGVRSGIPPIPTPMTSLIRWPVALSHSDCGQIKKLVSVFSLSLQLLSLWVDSDLGVDVRQGSTAGLGLTFGRDVCVPAVAGWSRSLVDSCCSPCPEPPRALPLGWKLLPGPVPKIGLMLAMVAGKGLVAGRGKAGRAGLPSPNLLPERDIVRVALPHSWCEDVAPSVVALK